MIAKLTRRKWVNGRYYDPLKHIPNLVGLKLLVLDQQGREHETEVCLDNGLHRLKGVDYPSLVGWRMQVS